VATALVETKFKENELLKQEHKKNLKTSIDWIMVKPPKSLQAFKLALEKEKINLVIRQNDSGIVYGLTYIDHNTKCVFNGSDIGKEYSAKGILEKCGIAQLVPGQNKSIEPEISIDKKELANKPDKQHEQLQDSSNLLDILMTPKEEYNYLPYELRKQKKKKRK
jgi:hypothetical protein